MENILTAFIFYRPDIGYISEIMPNLLSVLLVHLDEYNSFKCFINLLHSFHFLSLFRGDMREIEWRVRFFNEYLFKIKPLVH